MAEWGRSLWQLWASGHNRADVSHIFNINFNVLKISLRLKCNYQVWVVAVPAKIMRIKQQCEEGEKVDWTSSLKGLKFVHKFIINLNRLRGTVMKALRSLQVTRHLTYWSVIIF